MVWLFDEQTWRAALLGNPVLHYIIIFASHQIKYPIRLCIYEIRLGNNRVDLILQLIKLFTPYCQRWAFQFNQKKLPLGGLASGNETAYEPPDRWPVAR